MKPVIVHRAAKSEWDHAIAHYESQVPGLGLDFHAQVEQAIQKIQRGPEMWPPHALPPFRKYVLDRFPFLIFYMDRPNDIWIVAVAHAKRRPGHWSRRRPQS